LGEELNILSGSKLLMIAEVLSKESGSKAEFPLRHENNKLKKIILILYVALRKYITCRLKWEVASIHDQI
jgi:hypothetical protein